jgi:putative transposase
MTKAKQSGAFKGHRFPPEIIFYAVWAYFRFPMSFRDIEDLLYKRGVIVSYETIRSWVGKFGTNMPKSYTATGLHHRISGISTRW